jgi:hypothetical protein
MYLTDICSVTVPARAALLPVLDVVLEVPAEAFKADSVEDTAVFPVLRRATSVEDPTIMRVIARPRR